MASFKEAFAAARKAGKKTFTWNGKPYTTKLKEEVSSAPKTSKRPMPKPAAKVVEAKASAGRVSERPVSTPSKLAPKASLKPLANPRNAPSFADKLRMGSAARSQATLDAAEQKKRRAAIEAASARKRGGI